MVHKIIYIYIYIILDIWKVFLTYCLLVFNLNSL